MFDYSARIEAFRRERVRLSGDFLELLLQHRKANRDRLIARLSDHLKRVTISESSFKPQGSVAHGLIIQTRFADEEYDIDDGLVLERSELKDDDDRELGAIAVKEKVRAALEDKRFSRQPALRTNCVRVFYANEDAEKHHVDFPVYRRWTDDSGVEHRELASDGSWNESDPTQVNSWFATLIADRNKQRADWGTQCRRLIQLLKRFARSRRNWDLPNGMKLMMLVVECQPAYEPRIDVAFRRLLEGLDERLRIDKVIRNLAHPDRPALTKSVSDPNVQELQDRIGEALDKLRPLDDADNHNATAARKAWDWIFQSDGFFEVFDEKEEDLAKKVKQLAAGTARTSSVGVIGSVGVVNRPHNFYGETFRTKR